MEPIVDFINLYINPISIVLGLASSLGAGFAWWNTGKIKKNVKKEKARLNAPIQIKIVDVENTANRAIDLPGDLRRGDLTRAELLGYIGMIPIDKKLNRTRFELCYPSTSDFFDNLQRVQKSSGEDILEVKCTSEEYDQFDFKALEQSNTKLEKFKKLNNSKLTKNSS